MARIGIDATSVMDGGKGVSLYQKNIVRELTELNGKDDFFVFHRPESRHFFNFDRSNWHGKEVKIISHIFWEQVQLPWWMKKLNLDLFHTTSDGSPLFGNTPSVVYLFEIPNHRVSRARKIGYQPRWYQRLSEAYGLRIFPYSVRKSKLVLTSSRFTQSDLVNHFDYPLHKTEIVHAATGSEFRPANDEAAISRIRSRVSGGAPYVLHFSTGDPRDNTDVVLSAFRKVRSKITQPIKLLIVGGGPSEEQGALPSNGKNGSIVRKPFTTGKELIELYQGALIYVDPSLYEGFGFQLLEAMACGIPIVASNVTSIPEVVGDAGVLLEPNDISGFSRAMIQILTDKNLEQELRRAGVDRARTFTWRRTAEQVLEAFEATLNGTERKDFTEKVHAGSR